MRKTNILSESDQLLLAMLKHVPFDGWSWGALRAGMRDLDKDPNDIQFIFSNGPKDAARHFGVYFDQLMSKTIDKKSIDLMPVREKIKSIIEARLELFLPFKESIRSLLSFLSLPGNKIVAFQLIFNTVDEIWSLAGDQSTDYNYYSKRTLLTGVYGSTILYWLSDNDDKFPSTRTFLERRINDVMLIPKLKRSFIDKLASFDKIMKGFKKNKLA
ncbi:MAG: COQ9 family protein [Rhodospirillaceae bacterium]|nr:COQ9 family protein [Rhodospirillaceae bacterium]OUT78247.1 MAG: hypothetical protein CBB83_06720 [Rhodospirillaceae bacterium TMED23]|tara:strand:+ start:1192 stop:1836 length:645 start_codon:yes stop_codon:yes gene_type:complete